MHPTRKRKLAATATVLVGLAISAAAAVTTASPMTWQTPALLAIAAIVAIVGASALYDLNRKDHQ